MKYTQEEIKPFIDACDAMARSKFILVDKRIGDILKSIATTKPVYNAIAESMINFNWAAAWKTATSKNGELIVPDESSRLIAFVFCLLKNVDAGKVNINEVLVKYCSNDEERRSNYVVFCEKTIVPFKNQLVSRLCGTKVEKQESQPEQKVSINTEVNNRLEFLVKDIKAYVIGIKKLKGCAVSKADYIDLVEGFISAIKAQHDQYYAVFTTTLHSLVGKDKELKNRLNAIIELISHIKE